MNLGEKTREISAELVIIGAGGAGLAAAITAFENGVTNIIVLEKRGITGGSSAMAVGPFGADSPTQARQGISVNKDELFIRAMNWAHWRINPNILRAFIDKSGDTIRWLEEKGLFFDCKRHAVNDNPLTWHVPRRDSGRIMPVLANECERLGIKILLHTPAKKILMGDEDNVVGVLAEREGEIIQIASRSVIIASGGYLGNKDLLAKYVPQYNDNIDREGVLNTGDGLQMAMEVGGATDGLGILLLSGPSVPFTYILNLGNEQNLIKLPLRNITNEPSMIWVNKNGERFIDESIPLRSRYYETSNAIMRQPDTLSYTLWDMGIVQMILKRGISNPTGGQDSPSDLSGLERELKLQADKGRIKMSDSWNDLADWIGADRSSLINTIDTYNIDCDRLHDSAFLKSSEYLLPLRKPPYYAVKCKCHINNTIGGIKINEKMQVLNKSFKPIRGLYAAGVDTGGWISETYCVTMPGTAFGFALNSGRIAAENAIKN